MGRKKSLMQDENHRLLLFYVQSHVLLPGKTYEFHRYRTIRSFLFYRGVKIQQIKRLFPLGIDSMLVQCWVRGGDGQPTIDQHLGQ